MLSLRLSSSRRLIWLFGGISRGLVAEIQNERFPINEELAVEQRGLAIIFILRSYQSLGGIFGQRENEVFRVLQALAHGLAADVMRNLHGKAFYIRVVAESGDGKLEDRQHHVLKRAQCAVTLAD